MESLVTGLLFIALDFFPDTPINLVQRTDGDYKYPEIPTLPTTLEQAKGAVTRIMNKLEEIDFKELGANLRSNPQRCQSHREFSRDRVGAAFFGAGHAQGR